MRGQIIVPFLSFQLHPKYMKKSCLTRYTLPYLRIFLCSFFKGHFYYTVLIKITDDWRAGLEDQDAPGSPNPYDRHNASVSQTSKSTATREGRYRLTRSKTFVDRLQTAKREKEDLIINSIGTLRSDNGDGDGNVRSLGRAGPRRVGVPAKIEITNFTSENVDDGH